MLNEQTLTYIVSFLAQGTLPCGTVGYTANEEEYSKYKIVVVPSSFFTPSVFGTARSLPVFPLQKINNIPLLFGQPKVEKHGQTLVVYADIIASTFFLISRYEELVNAVRDAHGRFPGRSSVPFRGEFMHRPIVDEYGFLLREWLRSVGVDIQEPVSDFSKIYLTHDADKITQLRNFRGFCGGVLRCLLRKGVSFRQLISALHAPQNDSLFTFPWLFAHNAQVPNAETIVFVKAGKSGLKQDVPMYNLKSSDAQCLFDLCKKNNVHIGLHTSYLAGEQPKLAANEKQRLEQILGVAVKYNRHHYLRSCEPQDMQALITSGISDDFTLGYADMAGFRLGTCRAVKWINPQTKELTNLTLHPLTAMDCSLSGQNYMNMDYEDALAYCSDLIAQVKKHGGELVLLWHNSSVADYAEHAQMYHRTLYPVLLNKLL